MDLGAQITRIRRFLRDPNANIWDDATLINFYNDTQEELQHRTSILADLTAIRVPPMYQFTYMHDWEWAYLPSGESQFYQCFSQHQQADHIHTYDWEVQHVWQLTPDISDIGGRVTHMWETFFLGTPSDEMKIRFPKNFSSVRHISCDRWPVEFRTRKEIMKTDPSFKSYTGRCIAYYRDELDNSFVLYPRPTVATWLDGDGMALFNSNDTIDQEAGTLLRRYDSTMSQNGGIPLDVIDADNNVILFYDLNPTDLTKVSDVSDFPVYLRKYIEYGVISKAYGANTDGRIKSLSDYWNERFELGVAAVSKFMNRRYVDRDYRLMTKGASVSRMKRKHPRLPSTYPHVI